MKAKEYLTQLRQMDRMISLELEKLEYWREMSTRIGGCRFEEKHNPNRPAEAPYVKAVEKIAELENRIAKELEEFVDFKAQLSDMVRQIPNFDERMVIELRYIDNLPWDEIADRCGYTLRWVYKLHGRGLLAFEGVMKEGDVL